jgi:hypothetical protein
MAHHDSSTFQISARVLVAIDDANWDAVVEECRCYYQICFAADALSMNETEPRVSVGRYTDDFPSENGLANLGSQSRELR